MRRLLLVVPALLLLASESFADPILSATPSQIALSPTQTVISFSVDPNGTPVAALVVDLSALTLGLQILAIASSDASIGASGPAPSGGDTIASFVGSFASDRIAPFAVGTLTVQGVIAGAALVASGNYTEGGTFNDLLFGPTSVATVVPEPGTAALIGLGFALLVALRRSSP